MARHGGQPRGHRQHVARVSVEQKHRMSNVKRLRRSSSLVVAVTFLAISFAMGPVRTHADELAVDPCPLPTEIMDVTVAEELDVSCHARAAVVQLDAAMIEASP